MRRFRASPAPGVFIVLLSLAGCPSGAGQGWSGGQFDDWAASWLFGFSGIEASAYGDPDRDQAINFVEFGRGTDPLTPDPKSAGHFQPRRDSAGGVTEFGFAAVPDLSEVAWSYRLSNDLQHWRDAFGEASIATTPAGEVENVVVAVSDGTPPARALFGRVGWTWLGNAVGDPLLRYSFDAGSPAASGQWSALVTGGDYDTSRFGAVAGRGAASTTVTIGSGEAAGTDVTGEVPVTTWIRNDAPNDDKEDYHIYTGSLAGGWDLRGLLAFDLSAIPGTATLTNAAVSLWQSGYTTGNADNEPSQQVDLELFSMTGPVTNQETWNSAGPLYGTSLASSAGDPSVTTAGIEHRFSGPAVQSEIQSALGAGTVYFGLVSPDLETQSIRHFFVLDGAPASNPSASGPATGPSLEVTYTGSGNHLAEAPSTATAATLADAIAGDSYHEFVVNVASPGRADLLTLVFDHYGTAEAANFTSHVAVFANPDGFAHPPVSSESLHISSAMVSAGGDPSLPLDTVQVPLAVRDFQGTLTVRFYFYDDANHSGSVAGIDDIQVFGFPSEELLVRYDFNGGGAAASLVAAPASVGGGDFAAAVGGFSVPNQQAYASSIDTEATLDGALAGGDYQEVAVTVSDPAASLLTLRFDHHGSAPSGGFTSNIAVFASADGFGSLPVTGQELAASTVAVPANHAESVPLRTVQVPLGIAGFIGTLTFRFYFFDDVDQQNNYNRIDTVQILGDVPGGAAVTVEKIITPDYAVQIANPGFRMGITTARAAVIPPDEICGLSFLGSAVAGSVKISEAANTTIYGVTNGTGQTALVEIVTNPHTVEIAVTLEDGLAGEIRLRTGSPGPAYGLGDRGGWESNANLATVQKSYPMRIDAGRYRWNSSFLIFPRAGAAGAFFQRQNGTVSIGPDYYEMANASASQQRFYYFTGSMEDIYAAWRETRIAEGFPGVAPKMDGFELGFETWDLLRWNTNAATVQSAIQEFLNRDYRIRWAVTGSGFWQAEGTTASFGLYDLAKYPESTPPLPPDLGDWLAGHGIRWMIGQRTNFVKLGGPHSSNPGESGATVFDTSPNSQEGIDNGYLLLDGSNALVERTSPVFPTVPCYLLDGNVPGAAAWFKNLYDMWGVDGVKEDTMLVVPDHTIYNAPMRAIAESGDLVMARCGTYSSPGTLTRVNDTGGAGSMTLRCPVNYLQFAASAAPNVYSDTVGFGSVGNVTSTLRHGWLLSLTAGLAVSDSPWNHGWSGADEANFRKIADFHYRYGPYMYSAAVESHVTGFPHTMTPLPIAFPDDAASYDLAGIAKRQFQWMIGPSLLATPLLHANYAVSNAMDIYLPAGKWIDYESGQHYQGPTTLEDFSMPPDKTPVFVGGKGVVVARIADGQALQAVVYPIATGGSSYTFTHPDGTSTSTITNNNAGWDAATLLVTDTTTSAPVSFTTAPNPGAIAFAIAPGHDYALSGGM